MILRLQGFVLACLLLVTIFCAQMLASGADKAQSLRGTPMRHRLENDKADEDGLSRIKDQAELSSFVALGLLVLIPENESIKIDDKASANHRYCRPWTRDFLLDFGPRHRFVFNKRLKVTSGIRTKEDNIKLGKHNTNVSPTSTHQTGATVDISWKGMSKKEIAWMVTKLYALQTAGKLQATQEISHQPCFHILVFKKYSERPAKNNPVSKKGGKKK